MIQSLKYSKNFPLCFFLALACGNVSAEECNPNDVNPSNNGIPSKILKIYNNTNSPIYPVIETSTNSVDEWLQAEFSVCKNELNIKKFPHTELYRVYVNWPSGISPGNYTAIKVPFYSELSSSPNPIEPNQYINWWNGGRVKIYDSLLTVKDAHDKEPNPVSPNTLGLSCAEVSDDECSNLSIYSDKAALTDESPSQLTEYTFGGAIRATDPYTMAYQDVDYDISYVDHLYLPIAMGPIGNSYIGYSGTIKSDDQFTSILNRFLSPNGIGYGWPVFIIPGDKESTIKKIPGAYNAIQGVIGQSITNPGAAIENIYSLWANCIPYYRSMSEDSQICPNSMKADLEKINNFFMQNYNQYENDSECDPKNRVIKTPKRLLAQIYGWVPFNQYCTKGAAANSLCKTSHNRSDPAINDPEPTKCTEEYYSIHKLYRKMEYSYKEYQVENKYNFNPYVQLIHGEDYLNMDAYAFSIDDAVGNMQELGTGLVITVGGPKGLENDQPFNPRRAIMVNLGSPKALNRPDWLAYGACDKDKEDCETGITLPINTTSFKLGTIKSFPIKVVIKDSEQRKYEFEITGLSGNNTLPDNAVNKASCKAPDKGWCDGLYVYISTDENGHKVNNIQGPPPPAL